MRKFLLLIASLIVISACSTNEDTSIKNTSTTETSVIESAVSSSEINPQELSPEEVTQLYQEEQLAVAITDHLENLNEVSSTITTEFTWNDQSLHKTQTNYEEYQDTLLNSYIVDSTTSNNDQQLEQDYYFDGENFYQRYNQLGWNQLPTETKHPMTYLYFLKYLVEGNEPWTIDIDSQENVHVKKEITDPVSLESIPNIIDIPVIISPKASYDAHFDYIINTETGEINQGVLNVSITDLGEEFNLEYTIDSQFNDQAQKMSVDLEEEATLPNADFLTNFIEANPSDVITYYEATETKSTVEAEPETTVTINNPINSIPWVQMNAPIVDQQPSAFSLVVKDQYFGSEQEVESINMSNHYHHFTQRFINEFELLEEIESTEEPVYTYREYHENDFASIEKFVGDMDVSHIDREQDAMYAIDYLIDKETYQLLGIIVWSVTPEEEQINVMTALNFGQFNVYSPKVMSTQVSEVIWQTANDVIEQN